MTIYSKQLFCGSTTGSGTSDLFTAAAGVTTVIRCIDIVPDDSGSTIQVKVSSPLALLMTQTLASAGAWYPWRGRQVILPGQVIQLTYTGAASCFIIVSGYELQ